MEMMKPLSEMRLSQPVKYLFTDVDGTLTSGGVLVREAYEALWLLREAGVRVIPVSGGSAGVAVHAVRAWPVDAFVTESGACAFYKDQGRVLRLDHEALPSDVSRQREGILKQLCREFPFVRVAGDQFSRLYDLALDHSEEEPFWERDRRDEVVRFLESGGVPHLISSIHINVLPCRCSKLDMTRYLVEHLYHLPLDELIHTSFFVGDAPNDGDMFEFFSLSAGVKNLEQHSHEMPFLPNWISCSEGGVGFREIAEQILAENEKY